MRLRLSAILAFTTLSGMVLSGCGGDSGSSNTSATKSPYAGAYSGTFVSNGTAGTQNGTLTISVGTDGRFSGTSHNSTQNLDATNSGSIDSSGSLTSTFVYPNGTYTASGTIAKNSSNHIVGTLTQYSGTTNVGPVTVDLTQQ